MYLVNVKLSPYSPCSVHAQEMFTVAIYIIISYSSLDREVNAIWVHIGFSFIKIEKNSVPQKISTQKIITKINKKSWHLMLKRRVLLISWSSSRVSLSGAPGIRQNGSKFYYLITWFSPGLTVSGTIKCELHDKELTDDTEWDNNITKTLVKGFFCLVVFVVFVLSFPQE